MNIQVFRKITIILLAAFLFSTTGKVQAQVDDNHFIYIQADNRKPFYVILNDKLYSSSSIGYLIIPKLKSGTYNITLGFPQNAAPEQRFVTVIRNNDIGYSLKSANGNTYTLTDLQTQEVLTSNGKASQTAPPVQQPVTARTEPPVAEEKTRTVEEVRPVVQEVKAQPVQEQQVAVTETPAKPRGFGDLMSSVANDPDLAKPAEKPQPPTPKKDPFEEVKIVRSTDTPQETPVARETPPVVTATARPAQTVERAVVTTAAAPALPDTYGVVRTKDNANSEGREMSFVLLSNTMTDSVTIFIPNDEDPAGNTGASNAQTTERRKSIAYFDYEDLAQTPPAESNTSRRRNRNNNEADEKFLNTNTTAPAAQPKEVDNPFYSANNNTATNEEKKRTEEVTQSNIPVVSGNTRTRACTGGSISDRDFNKVRNKMIGRDNDDEMVSTAMDMLGNQCITTEKVKTLGGLFITDNGRLKFFSAVEKNVSDKQNFASLEEQLYDRGRKEQFRNIINR